MFGLLKKKIADFVSGLTKREEKEAASAPPIGPEKKEEEKIEEIGQAEEEAKEMPEAAETMPEIEEPAERTHEPIEEKTAPEKEIGKPTGRKQEPEKEIEEIGFPPQKIETKEEAEQVARALERIEPIVATGEQAGAPSEEALEKIDFAKPAAKEKKPALILPEKEKGVLRQAMKEISEAKPVSSRKKEEPGGIKPMFPQRVQPAQKTEPQKEEKKGIFSFISGIVGKKPEEKKIQQPPVQKPESIHPAASIEGISETILPPRQHAQEKPKQSFSIPFITPSARKEERKMEVKVGFGSTIKSIFTGEVEIRENDVSDLLSELEVALLESDVAYDVSLAIASELKSKLVGMKVRRGEVQSATKNAIKEVIISVLSSERQFDLVSRASVLPKPVPILFVGPNGAGKTTTMAKIAQMLQNSGMSVLFSASDTFRAAAIEQTEAHGSRLGVHVIKNAYGSDPASVAFDALAYARAHNISIVLIDSAGRQDTNVNLLDELRKINRIAKPALKIYIGESIAGNAIIDQIKAFDAAIGIDGVILTKLDCDAKGGTALSVTHTTGIPILFLGTGQEYGDLMPFSPSFIAEEILT